jgi:pantoate--beta-alanine ligase
MRIIHSVKEMQETADDLRKEKRIGFVPTMGYLHEGHLSLVQKARELADSVVVSIFVNPIQFGPQEDLSRYPRDFERDKQLLEGEGTDIIFFPTAEEMYPSRYSTYVEVKGLSNRLCGLKREGHFLGVATVVAKLINAVKPTVAIFGQKDFQQLKVIERMVRDLNMDVEIVGCPTFREKDGLAMSSRNTYLTAEERQKALLLSKSIERVKDLFQEGVRKVFVLREEAAKVLSSTPGIEVEYVSICDPETLDDIDHIDKSALYALAVRIGKTRLIDNVLLTENT